MQEFLLLQPVKPKKKPSAIPYLCAEPPCAVAQQAYFRFFDCFVTKSALPARVKSLAADILLP